MRTKRVFSWKAFMNDCVECATAETYKYFISQLPSYKDWVTVCESKTREECEELGFVIHDNWCVDAQVKTYVDDFLERFPNAKLTPSKKPACCRDRLYGDAKCVGMSCDECWDYPYEEVE